MQRKIKQVCESCGEMHVLQDGICKKCDKQYDAMIEIGIQMVCALKMAVDYTILHGIETGKYELRVKGYAEKVQAS